MTDAAEVSAAPQPKPVWGNLVAHQDFLARTRLWEQPADVLEIGCGSGVMLRALLSHGHRAVGIDIDPEGIKDCGSSLPVCWAYGEALPFRDVSFDFVIGLDVFEHIPDTDRHLEEVRRVLRASGYYLLATPNIIYNVPFEMLRTARERGLRHMFAFLEPYEHCSLHSYWGIRRRLELHGFAARFHDVPAVNNFFTEKLRRYAGRHAVRLLDVCNPDRLPIPLRTNFFVEATRVSP